MTTLADLIADTKRHLLSGGREQMNKLATAATEADTTLLLTYDLGAVQAGAYLQIDLEVMYVWQVDASAKSAIVERGQLGSTAAAHSASAVVTVNPSWPDFAVAKALNEELRSLSAPSNGLFAVRSVELTASAAAGSYDLTSSTDVLEVLSVRHSLPGLANTWATLTNYELAQNAGSGFASGSSLVIHDGISQGRTIRVLYKASFDPLTNLTDNVETISGLPASAHDIPPLGAAMRLVAPREIRRNQIDSQGGSRRSEEVPPGAVAASLRGIASLRQQRIVEEASLLAQRHPDRGFIPSGPLVW